MRICFRVSAVALLVAGVMQAQTLARPGWAGSGLTPEPWWRHAVIYRLDEATLPSVGELPSFQAFGVDALMLTTQAVPAGQAVSTDAGGADAPLSVDDLLFECSRLRIRVIVPLDVTGAHDDVLALARSWLYRGAAGFVLTGLEKLPRPAADPNAVTAGPVRLHRGAASGTEPAVVTDLRKLVAASAGERILVGAEGLAVPMPSLQLQIVSLGAEPGSNAQIAMKLASYSTMSTPRALLTMEAGDTAMTPIDAALLLATDQPAILDSSRLKAEMLVKVFPPLAKAIDPDAAVKAPAAVAVPPSPENVYGAYHEYVRKPDNAAAERRRKAAEEKAKQDEADIAFATFPVQPMYQAMSNTPEGLVAFYHRVVQLHRSNQTLREGTLFGLHTVPQAVAWTALHAGSAPVLVVCNPTDAAVRANVSEDLRKLKMNRNTSRTLLHTGAASAMEDDDAIGVPAHGVYVGELARGYSYK